jgi:galactoside O-acetyltransferase
LRDIKFRESGKDIVIYDPVTLINAENMILRNHILISEYAYIAAGLGLHIGNFIHIATHTSISGGGFCVLEDFVGVCAGARLITGSEDITGRGIASPLVPDRFRPVIRSYVHCKRHSFVSTNVVVMPGVTLGEGSVVGSGSVVIGDLEPWGIYIGSPAKRVKDRPKEKVLQFEEELYREKGIEMSDASIFIDAIREMNLGDN